jgi:hypothetical protein
MSKTQSEPAMNPHSSDTKARVSFESLFGWTSRKSWLGLKKIAKSKIRNMGRPERDDYEHKNSKYPTADVWLGTVHS